MPLILERPKNFTLSLSRCKFYAIVHPQILAPVLPLKTAYHKSSKYIDNFQKFKQTILLGFISFKQQWQVQKVLERLKNQFITLMSKRVSNGPLSCQAGVSRLYSHSAPCKIARNDPPAKDIITIDRIQQLSTDWTVNYVVCNQDLLKSLECCLGNDFCNLMSFFKISFFAKLHFRRTM